MSPEISPRRSSHTVRVPLRCQPGFPKFFFPHQKNGVYVMELYPVLLTNEAINDTFRGNIYEEAIYLFTECHSSRFRESGCLRQLQNGNQWMKSWLCQEKMSFLFFSPCALQSPRHKELTLRWQFLINVVLAPELKCSTRDSAHFWRLFLETSGQVNPKFSKVLLSAPLFHFEM